MSDSVRLFIGARVSMATVSRLTEAQAALATATEKAELALRWVSPATFHVTLQFLGWCRPEVIEALRDRVGEALRGRREFEITTQGLGAFPSADKARVLWAGVKDDGHLAELAGVIGETTAALGFPGEKRAFHPHVTIARAKKVADVAELLVPYAEQSFSGTSVNSVILFESVLKSSGSEYVERASWPLEASSKSQKRQTEGLDQGLTDNEED